MKNIESKIRSYSRSFPTKFIKAMDSSIFDENSKEYIDFFTGAGTMNYGHNNYKINEAMINYIKSNNIMHSLDLQTQAKEEFLNKFYKTILQPRSLNYKVQFVAPSGANGVEAAIKLCRKSKKRKGIISFTNSFHGMSLGALSVTGNSYYKNEFINTNSDVSFCMYDKYFGKRIDTAEILRKLLSDSNSGIDIPAAIILETIQADGGVNVASIKWLQKIRKICKQFDILLIVDDVQVGCGRSGDFFSFERANIVPDLIIISKAIGAGMPLSIVLSEKNIDNNWKYGEHTGTFRGNNLAFVAGKKALEYWEDESFSKNIKRKGRFIKKRLKNFAKKYEDIVDIRGVGLIYGIELSSNEIALKIREKCFNTGLLVELVGGNDNTVKLLPPLTISDQDLDKGLTILLNSLESILTEK